MNKIALGMGIALASLALAACETPGAGGTGAGNVRGTQKPVAFTWQSDDSDSGDITATFGNGRVFKGKYYQITDSTRVEHLDPLWDGWARPARSGGWRYWSEDDRRDFVREYEGRVLESPRIFRASRSARSQRSLGAGLTERARARGLDSRTGLATLAISGVNALRATASMRRVARL
jgi:hypothetical protein